jgi:uncharacterized protein (TIGR03790 family)
MGREFFTVVVAAVFMLFILFSSACMGETIPGPGRDSNSSETGDPDPGLFSHVMVVYNTNYALDNDSNGVQDSLEIANYYMAARRIPPENICPINTSTSEEITRGQYDQNYDPSDTYPNNTHIKQRLEECLGNRSLNRSTWFIALSKGIPLKISAYYSSVQYSADYSSVDSAVSLLFSNYTIVWRVNNPYYAKDSDLILNESFRNFRYNGSDGYGNNYSLSYLTTRLDGYNVSQVLGMIDRSVHADTTRHGQWVIDDDPSCAGSTCDYMPDANALLCGATLNMSAYVSFDISTSALKTPANANNNAVIGYTSHGIYGPGLGSNFIENGVITFALRNGSIYTSWESFNGYSYANPGAIDHNTVADWIRFGGTGGLGSVYEPWCSGIAQEHYLFSRYALGYTFAESAYMSIPYSDFTNTVGGDPIMVIVPDNTTPVIVPNEINWTRLAPGDWINITVYEDYPDVKYIDYNGTPVYFNRTYKFNTSGWSYGIYNFTVFGNDTAGNSVAKTYFFEINETSGAAPNFSSFDGSTTQFHRVMNRSNLSNAVIERADHGRISFLENVNVSGLNLNHLVNITGNHVSVDSQAATGINRSANVTIYNLNYTVPSVYRDGEICPYNICTILNYSGGNLTFSVTGFTSYSAGPNTNITVWDETDDGMPYSGFEKRVGDMVKFFANYTNATSGEFVQGASCSVYLNGSWLQMPYNSSGFYEYNNTASNYGIISYTVGCNRTGFEPLNATDTFSVLPALVESPPVITGPLNGTTKSHVSVNITWSSNGTSFTVQADDDMNFMSPAVNASGVMENYYYLPDHGTALVPGLRYYVRVKSNTSGWGYLTTSLGENVSLIENYSSTRYNFYPSIATDSNGIIHMAWYGLIPGAGSIYNIRYANSTNWGNTVNVTNTTPYDQYYPSITADRNGTAHIVWWAQTPPSGKSNVLYANSTNWTKTVYITNTTSYDDYYPDVMADENGMVHVAWMGRCDESPSDDIIRYANSSNFSNVVNIIDPNTVDNQFYPSIFVDVMGIVHVVWEGNTAGVQYRRIKYSNSTNFTNIFTLPGVSNYDYQRPSLAMDRDFLMHIAFYGKGSCSSSYDNIMYTNSVNFNDITNLTCQNSYNQRYPVVAVDSSGIAHIAWHGAQAGIFNLDYVQYTNTTNLSKRNDMTGDLVNAQKYPSVAAFGNSVHIVWHRSNRLYYTNNIGSFLAVDIMPPSVSMVSPLSATYSTASVWFNVSLDENASWCGLSIDGAQNITMNSTSNDTNTSYGYMNSSVMEGTHYAIFSCNDTFGNMNVTSPRYFTVSIPEQEGPQPPGGSTGPAFYYPSNASSRTNRSSQEGCPLEIITPRQITMALSKAGWVDVLAKNYGNSTIYGIEFNFSMPHGWQYHSEDIGMLGPGETGKSTLNVTPSTAGSFGITVTAVSGNCTASSLFQLDVISAGNGTPSLDAAIAGQMIDKAMQAIDEGARKGLDMHEAEDLLSQASSRFRNGEYNDAGELAKQAYDAAMKAIEGTKPLSGLSAVISWVMENALAAGIIMFVVIALRRVILLRNRKEAVKRKEKEVAVGNVRTRKPGKK